MPIKRIGINDRFGESGKPEELWEKYGLTAKNIIKAVREVLKVRQLCSVLHVPSVESGGEGGARLRDIEAERELRIWGGETIRTIPELKEDQKKTSGKKANEAKTSPRASQK